MPLQGVGSWIGLIAKVTLVFSCSDVKLHVGFKISTTCKFQVAGWATIRLQTKQRTSFKLTWYFFKLFQCVQSIQLSRITSVISAQNYSIYYLLHIGFRIYDIKRRGIILRTGGFFYILLDIPYLRCVYVYEPSVDPL